MFAEHEPGMATRSRLVLGTRSKHKVAELCELLKGLDLDIVALDALAGGVEVVEDGASFAENARKKATQQAQALGAWVLAEDSGLVVDALQGAPGILSARYSDPGATDERNNDKLLAELAGLPPARRTAHYVCHAVLADPRANVRAECVGRCQGRLLAERRGTAGFGYDPLFEIVEYHQTFAELGAAVKRALSHRARAIAGLRPHLCQLLGKGSSAPRRLE